MGGAELGTNGLGTNGLGAAASKQAELVQFKLRMDGLKDRLTNKPGDQEQLRKACQDFEAVFIGKLWEQMEKTVPKEGYLHSKQEGMYKSMFNREFSESMAEAGGIGLADMLYDQLAQKLKQVSSTTLAANSEIKPLAENGMPELKGLHHQREETTRLGGPEPQAPSEITPENVGPDASQGADVSAAGQGEPYRDVSSLTPPQVEAELNALARALRPPAQGRMVSSISEEGEIGREIAQI